MVKKVLSVALVTMFTIPTVVHADVTISGLIQAEAGSVQSGRNELDEKNDRIRTTKDSSGAIRNGGVNKIAFGIDEKISSNLTAIAVYEAGYNIADNEGLLTGKESWLGLKGQNVWFKFGTISSAYKALKNVIDPYSGVSLQLCGTAGGMSGVKFNAVQAASDQKILGRDGKMHYQAGQTVSYQNQPHFSLAHNGFAKNILELGGTFGDFEVTFQGFFDETDDLEGGGSLSLVYANDQFTAYAAASYTDLKDLEGSLTNNDEVIDNLRNLKVGAQYRGIPGLKLTLQFEDVEFGMLDGGTHGTMVADANGNLSAAGGNTNGGKYLVGSFEYAIPNSSISLAGWVGGYKSDIDDEDKLIDKNGNLIDEDAVSFALGAKYFFSKKTFAYGGYMQADSDNNYRDENLFAVGLRHYW